MLRTPQVFGISMARRKSRRFLVAFTYAVMLALALTICIVPSSRDRGMFAGSAFALVCLLVFGKLVQQTGPLDLRGGEILSLGLVRRRHAQDEPDEREVAITNAACFQGYRVLALYSIMVYAATWLSFDVPASAGVKVLELLTMPLLGMALTLPQAALLWSEPDVPEEARV